MLKHSITLSSLILFAVLGCNRLQVSQVAHDTDEPAVTNEYTQIGLTRNSILPFDLDPPLTLKWEEDFQALPSNGFMAVNHFLFFGTHNGYVNGIDLRDGELMGKKSLGDACAVPPVYFKGILYQAFEAGKYGLIAIDLKSGDILWRIKQNPSRSAPIVYENKVCFQTLKGNISCYNYLTGDLIWNIDLKQPLRSSQAYRAGYLVSVTQGGEVVAMDHSSGIVLWRTNLGSPVFADPVIAENRLYVTTHSGHLHVMDLSNGKIIQTSDFGKAFYCGPTVDENHIYLGISNGRFLSLNKQDQSTLWTFDAEGPPAGPILVTPTYVYISTLGKKLYVLDKNNGHLIQEIDLSGRAQSGPLVVNNSLILACEDKQVVAYVKENK